jgi:hypothetical protein
LRTLLVLLAGAALSFGCSDTQPETPTVEGTVETVAPPAGAKSRDELMAEARAGGAAAGPDGSTPGDGR